MIHNELSLLVSLIIQNIGTSIISIFLLSKFFSFFLFSFLFLGGSFLFTHSLCFTRHTSLTSDAEFNTNEIDIQIASFDTIARFVAHDVPDLAMRAHIHTVCTGSLFLAKEQNELNASIQRVLTSLNEKK